MFYEIGKDYVKKEYAGSVRAAIDAGDFIAWTPEKIKGVFAFGNGTEKDFSRYMNDNKKYSYFIEI